MVSGTVNNHQSHPVYCAPSIREPGLTSDACLPLTVLVYVSRADDAVGLTEFGVFGNSGLRAARGCCTRIGNCTPTRIAIFMHARCL